MELLIFLLLSPAILAQRYGKNSNDPNDEPFLPIYPVYPYSPKLIKRGTDRDMVTQLTPELYAPKVDAKDSYSASYSTNYPRDPYYPNYNPYPNIPSSSSYSPLYNSMPYSYPSTPYNAYNSYSPPYPMTPSSPYSAAPYSSSYPNYYYQAPYYYPNYYTQPLFPPPPPPQHGADYAGSSDSYSDYESSNKNKDKKSGGNDKDKDDEQDSGQFVDGANYLAASSKDLDSQPSTYKVSSPQNQLEQVSTVRIKNLPIPVPKTTYRVISVAGQPVGPDYPLPAPYVKAQQLEDLMSETWAKLMLTQTTQPQTTPYPTYDTTKASLIKTNDEPYTSQNDNEPQRYLSLPNILAKTGLAYVINPNVLGKVSIAANGQILQAPTNLAKASKHPALTRINLDQSGKEQSVGSGEYDSYENQPSQAATQNYDGSSSQTGSKQTQSYDNDQRQPLSYQSQNYVTQRTPQAYSYQSYANFNPSQVSTQRQSQQYKTNLEDVNFGGNQSNKG